MAERARATKKHAANEEITALAKSKRKALKAPKPGKAGHNSGSVPDEVYERHLDKIETTSKAMDKAKEAYDQAKGVHQAAFKAAKGDGVNTDAVRLARSLHKRDHGVVAQDFADTGRVLRLINSPLGTQFGLFADVELPKPVSAVLQGQHAGKNGEDRQNNPFPPNTDEFVQWDGGWMEKQAEMVRKMGPGEGASAH